MRRTKSKRLAKTAKELAIILVPTLESKVTRMQHQTTKGTTVEVVKRTVFHNLSSVRGIYQQLKKA